MKERTHKKKQRTKLSRNNEQNVENILRESWRKNEIHIYI